jgi:hypothetical protein
MASSLLIDEKGYIQCLKKEQLRFVLRQVGSTPLKLYVEWPPAKGLLEMIPSSTSIWFLGVFDWETLGIDWKHFDHLNLRSLSMVHIDGLVSHIAEGFLDLLFRSTSEGPIIKYVMTGGLPYETFFAHKLMERVTKLEMEFGKGLFLHLFGIISEI